MDNWCSSCSITYPAWNCAILCRQIGEALKYPNYRLKASHFIQAPHIHMFIAPGLVLDVPVIKGWVIIPNPEMVIAGEPVGTLSFYLNREIMKCKFN